MCAPAPMNVSTAGDTVAEARLAATERIAENADPREFASAVSADRVRIVKSPPTLMLLLGATEVVIVGVAVATEMIPVPATGPNASALPEAKALFAESTST